MNIPKRIFIVISLGICLLMFIASFFISIDEANKNDITLRLCEMSAAHPIGCDLYGNDLLMSLILGAQTSIMVSMLTIILCSVVGTLLGGLAGYAGGWVDNLIMRIVDIKLAFPGILMALALTALLGPSLANIIFSISITGWTSFARICRGQVLSLKEMDFVYSARSLGASPFRVFVIHLLPNLWSSLLIAATFGISGVILTEASLGFLGLGPQDCHASWGELLSQGRKVLAESPRLSIFPGLMLALIVLGFNFLGDEIRDALDPKLKIRKG